MHQVSRGVGSDTLPTEVTSYMSFEDLSDHGYHDESITVDLTIISNDSVLTTTSPEPTNNICVESDGCTRPRKKQKNDAAAVCNEGKTSQDDIMLYDHTGNNVNGGQTRNNGPKVKEESNDLSTAELQSKQSGSGLRTKTVYRIVIVGGGNVGVVIMTGSNTTFRDLRCEITQFPNLPFTNFCFDLGNDLVLHSHQETLETDELFGGEGTLECPYVVFIRGSNK